MNIRQSGWQGWLDEMAVSCRLCPRECAVDRSRGEVGWCGVDQRARMYDEFVHYGEGLGLAPSYTVFLTGCNLKCIYCYTAEERSNCDGSVLDSSRLEHLMADARRRGALNLNFIGGEPTTNIPALVDILERCSNPLPLVWNTNGYASRESFEAIRDRVDLWLVDLKVGNPECGSKLLGADDYFDVCRQRLRELHAATPERVIVRHLLVPGHLDCCARPALEWIADKLPGIRCNVLLNYTVMPLARKDPQLGRFLTAAERRTVLEIAASLGLLLVSNSSGLVDVAELGSVRSVNEERESCAEIVISPAGEVHIRHPTSTIITVVADAVRCPGDEA